MKRHVKRLVSHPLISGGSIVFAGAFLVSVLNYINNLIMGRLLTIEEYGLLASLISFITIIAIFQTSLIQLFAKFSATYTAQKNILLKKVLFKNGLKISLALGSVIFALFLILLIPFSRFLHVGNLLLLVLVFISTSFVVFNSLPLGILQGELRFMAVSFLNVSAVICRIFFGVVLVLMGFGIVGAVIGIFLSLCIPYAISFLFHKSYGKIKDRKPHLHFFKEFKKVSSPFLFASMGVIVLQSTDVILARHFLSSIDAGRFAALSIMGKAIFYLTSPIFFAFFPLIAHKKERKESTRGTLTLAFAIVFLGNLFSLILYSTFPSLIIRIFFPQEGYQLLVPYLGLYAFFIMVFSIAFLLHNYFLSMGRTSVYKPSLIAAGIYFVLIFFFHKDIQQFISVLIASSLLLLLFLLVYYRGFRK